MPRAAPGVIAREALHRILPEYSAVSEYHKPRYREAILPHRWMESLIHPGVKKLISSFTPHNPDSWVERGRMGEVESLVGDCRPPPPGNPHQPTFRKSKNRYGGRLVKNEDPGLWYIEFLPNWRKNGGYFSPIIRLHSFNNNINLPNLKILDQLQYFKKTRSFFYCVDRSPMLRFVHSHCHLYGLRLVGSPPIVITSVLENKDNPYALSVL